MLNLLRSSSATAPGSRDRLSVGGIVNRATRLALMLAIVALGLMLVQKVRTVLRSSSAPSVTRRGTESEASSQGETGVGARPDFDPLSLQQGAWTFGDDGWMVRLIDLSTREGRARLQSVGSQVRWESKPSALEEQILRWLRHYRPAMVEGCRVYEVPLGAVQARLVTQLDSGRERLRLAHLLFRQGQSAQLLEASPAPDTGAAQPKTGHLLPLPAGVASVARRWDDSQRLSCEVLGPASWRECLRGWSAAGWAAEKRENAEPFSVILLRNGERGVRVYSLQADKPDSFTYLLLTAEP